jgi:hypothetical protein
MSKPICQAGGCTRPADAIIPGYALGVGRVAVRACEIHTTIFLNASDEAVLEARMTLARKRT